MILQYIIYYGPEQTTKYKVTTLGYVNYHIWMTHDAINRAYLYTTYNIQ
jgi:hypothetical protein